MCSSVRDPNHSGQSLPIPRNLLVAVACCTANRHRPIPPDGLSFAPPVHYLGLGVQSLGDDTSIPDGDKFRRQTHGHDDER